MSPRYRMPAPLLSPLDGAPVGHCQLLGGLEKEWKCIWVKIIFHSALDRREDIRGCTQEFDLELELGPPRAPAGALRPSLGEFEKWAAIGADGRHRAGRALEAALLGVYLAPAIDWARPSGSRLGARQVVDDCTVAAVWCDPLAVLGRAGHFLPPELDCPDALAPVYWRARGGSRAEAQLFAARVSRGPRTHERFFAARFSGFSAAPRSGMVQRMWRVRMETDPGAYGDPASKKKRLARQEAFLAGRKARHDAAVGLFEREMDALSEEREARTQQALERMRKSVEEADAKVCELLYEMEVDTEQLGAKTEDIGRQRDSERPERHRGLAQGEHRRLYCGARRR
ncbi:unnamed protein product [Prorocentrum cordatum]|uniref:Uncharacterized protein n=1 Tax=Prorocentrum cordatum TaxID=2364126 RepID=A0ABN9QZ44_9DINO|nr:unnamed protein product [Polarella glacialis]